MKWTSKILDGFPNSLGKILQDLVLPNALNHLVLTVISSAELLKHSKTNCVEGYEQYT